MGEFSFVHNEPSWKIKCKLVTPFYPKFSCQKGLLIICEYIWKMFSKFSEIETIEQYFPEVLFIMLYKVVLTSAFVDEILKCDHSNESY